MSAGPVYPAPPECEKPDPLLAEWDAMIAEGVARTAQLANRRAWEREQRA